MLKYLEFINENVKYLDIAKEYLKDKKIDIDKLQNPGGLCWWFANDFSKWLNNKSISNKVINWTGDKGNGNHLVVKIGKDYIDFTFNQFKKSEIPTIKKEEDYYMYYNEKTEFDTFSDFYKQWFESEKNFIAHLKKEGEWKEPKFKK